jgi:hypothetical protein
MYILVTDDLNVLPCSKRMSLCDDVFYYHVLPYVDFATLYSYRHHPKAQVVYQRRLSSETDITNKLFVAIDQDDVFLYKTAITQAWGGYSNIDLIHTTLNHITSSALRPTRIFEWLVDNAEEKTRPRMYNPNETPRIPELVLNSPPEKPDVFRSPRHVTRYHLSTDLTLIRKCATTSIGEKILPLLQFYVPEEDHLICNAEYILEVIEDKDSLICHPAHASSEFEDVFEYVTREMAIRILDPTVKEDDIPTEILEVLYERMYQILLDKDDFILITIASLDGYPNRFDSNQTLINLLKCRILGVEDYRRALEAFIDPTNYRGIVSAFEELSSFEGLDEYLCFVEYHIAEPEKLLDILYERDCERPPGYFDDFKEFSYLGTIVVYIHEKSFSPTMSRRLARYIMPIYNTTPDRSYAKKLHPTTLQEWI